MTQSRPDKAQKALEELCDHRGNTFYPHYHLAPRAGWMNDPNGMSWFNHRYHAFYQHNPLNENWGAIDEGNSISEDMFDCNDEPIALAPVDDENKEGYISVSAVSDNGVLSLIYTGHVWLAGEGNDAEIRQVQCLATSRDGVHFVKQGVVLTPPEGIMHFRDPKVWQQDGHWWMVVGAKTPDNIGQILLYRGRSLREWTFDRVLGQADDGETYMWECPDLFALGKHHYMMFSPQGMSPQGYHKRNLFQSGVIPGQWSPGSDFIPSGPFTELDNGHDFYAPQTFTACDGRRVMIGWMDMWESPMPTKKERWSGCLTLARELSEHEGKLIQRPVREAETLRGSHQAIPAGEITGTRVLQDNAQAVEVTPQWDLRKSEAEHYGLRLGSSLQLYVDNQAGRLVLWRHSPEEAIDGYRSIALPPGESLSLRIFLDMSSAEVFVNDGEAVLSSRIYPRPGERELSLYAAGGNAVLMSGALWSLS